MAARDARLDELSEDCSARFQIMPEAKQGSGNLARLRSRKAYDADPSTPKRRGDGDNSVVEVHGAIVAGKLRDDQGRYTQGESSNCQSRTNC